MLQWPSANTGVQQYWLRVYGWYALAGEASPQPKFCKRANFPTLDRNVEKNLK